eukprot:EG_transcript_2146
MSRIFSPFRAVGRVTSDLPVSVDPSSGDILTSVGCGFHVYENFNLRIVETHNDLPHPITALAQRCPLRFIGSGTNIYVYSDKRLATTLEHSPIGHVTHLVAFGDVLVSIGYDNTMATWIRDFPTLQYTRHCTVVFPPGLSCNAVCVPATYVNKVLLGSEQGCLHLFNIRTGEHLHQFKPFDCSIRSLAAGAVPHTVAVGLENGRVLLHNLVYDTTLFALRHSPESPVTALSFRCDGKQMLASGTAGGEVALWNLDEKRLDSLLTNTGAAEVSDAKSNNPHQGGITHLHFFSHFPKLLTAGKDNAIKLYSMVKVGAAQKLKERKGHFGPLMCARFFVDNVLVTASLDRQLRAAHVGTDAYNVELSQGNVESKARKRQYTTSWDLRLPPVTAFATCALRANAWAACVTLHEKSAVARAWRMDRERLMDWVLMPRRTDSPDGSLRGTAVAISRCGAFAVVGHRNGSCSVFSLQSESFLTNFHPEGAWAAHRAITGLHFSLNNAALIATSEDGYIRFWDYRKGTLLRSLYAGYKLTCTSYSPQNQHLAAACDDHSCRLYDVSLLHQPADVLPDDAEAGASEGAPGVVAPIRHFRGHTAPLTATLFSPDHAYLLTSSQDGTLRVYHIPTNQLVDLYKFEHHVTSMDFQPGAYFLATTHHKANCVFLWTNNLKYGLVPRVIHEESILSGPAQTLPVSSVDKDEEDPAKEKEAEGTAGGENPEEEEGEEEEEEETKEKEGAKPKDVPTPGVAVTTLMEPDPELLAAPKPGMLTFSDSAWPKWALLPHFDLIQLRNRPVVGPKSHRAPFFLPTTPGLQPKFDPEADEAVEDDDDDDGPLRPLKRPRGASHRLSLRDLDAYATPFVQRLRRRQYAPALEGLAELSQAKVDLELRDIEEVPDLLELLNCLLHHLRQRRFVEVVHACLSVVLKAHGERIASHAALTAALGQLLAAHQACREDLDRLVHYNLCLIRCATKAP